ncbi:MAG: hypothetical protein ACYCV8_05895 [bacterium]
MKNKEQIQKRYFRILSLIDNNRKIGCNETQYQLTLNTEKALLEWILETNNENK